MFNDQIITTIVIGLIITVLCLLSYFIGETRAKNRCNAALRHAGSIGENIKINGRMYKLVSTSEYINLVKRAEQAQDPIWNWATANGKQR